ncbi:MAG TPA: HAMP domain-containing sensor histidine kinase [bacterium]|nr:HAMP domain-containing sensor histidine kinase [bacterium]
MMQAKDQLLTDVSHELRSPLTRMRIALEMTPEGKVRDSMTRAVVEMETMLNELLETQRLRSGHGKLSLGPLDLNRLSQEMVEKYKDRDPGLMFSKSSPSCVVTADEGRIRTVFQNIIENALKYSGEQKKAVILAVEEAMESTIVTFIDYGPGIPKEEQEKVFEPFYRVDKSRTKETGGYGLGLSLCLEIMKAHGGDIKLESEVGQGTKVSLFFKR